MARTKLLAAAVAGAFLVTGSLACKCTNCDKKRDQQALAADTATQTDKATNMTQANTVQKREFGKTKDGQTIEEYTLRNSKGVTCKVITYGATLTEVWTPDKAGKPGLITCAFDNFAAYEAGHPFFGSTVGRYANRIGKGKFTLEGKEYTLAVNNGPNHLHGGRKGFDKAVWKATIMPTAGGQSVRLNHASPDMDEGYPGKLDVEVIFTLTEQNELRIDYEAKTDKTTVVNLTNHAYWNLHGPGNGTVYDHVMHINAEQVTAVDDTLIPTGELKSVEGTPLDFRQATPIGARIARIDPKIGGYDHNFVLKKGAGQFGLAARVEDPDTGRVMEVHTTEPGVQLYTGNFLDGKNVVIGGKGVPKHGAFCLETQHYPDSPNKKDFPSTVLNEGDTFTSRTVHRFSVRK
jgi:aldose 1-epimerase